MENNLQIFNSPEFGELQTLEVDGKIFFPATKAADALGYTNPKDAILRHCRGVVKHDLPHPQNPDKTIKMNFIDESDLYRLITHSKLPAAEKFEHWIFNEVIPSIRRNGYYAVEKPDSYTIQDPIARAKRWIQEEEERQRLIAENEAMKPKAQAYDDFVDRGHCVGFRDLAKQLKIKETILRQILFDIGWCYRGENGKLQPHKIYVDAGFLEVKDVKNDKNGFSGTQCVFTMQARDYLQRIVESIRGGNQE